MHSIGLILAHRRTYYGDLYTILVLELGNATPVLVYWRAYVHVVLSLCYVGIVVVHV